MGKDAHVIRGTDGQTSHLEGGAWYQLLDGAEYGFGDVSIIITEDQPNATSGADQTHRHPSHLDARDHRGPRPLHNR